MSVGACVVCQEFPNVEKLWELESVGTTKESVSPSETATVRQITSSI